MELKDIASIAGKSGLFKVLKPTRTGVILESLDEEKKKSIVGANARVSLLKEISIYTTSADSSLMLETVFDTIYKKHKEEIPVSSKSDSSELESFLASIVPNYDTERVYLSDIKKLVSWYSSLSKYAPELFKVKQETASDSAAPKKEGEKKTTTKKTAPPKATSTKKPTAKAKTTTPTASKSKRGA